MVWKEADLLSLITAGVQESVNLDYKACDALQATDGKRKELSKDVSAFANSAGGTIVYGMLEDGHVPTGLDVGYDPNVITKEWIEQVINSRIHRRIDGVRITQVELTTRPGRVAYVVEIPQTTGFPHQADDHRFYKRFNFQSVPMEEYEIRDVASRAVVPDLKIRLRLTGGQFLERVPAATAEMPSVELDGIIWNESAAPAEYTIMTYAVDERLISSVQASGYTGGGLLAIEHEGQLRGLRTFVRSLSLQNHMPIFQGAQFGIFSSTKPRISIPGGVGEYVIGWEVKSVGLPCRRGFCLLKSDGTQVSLNEIA